MAENVETTGGIEQALTALTDMVSALVKTNEETANRLKHLEGRQPPQTLTAPQPPAATNEAPSFENLEKQRGDAQKTRELEDRRIQELAGLKAEAQHLLPQSALKTIEELKKSNDLTPEQEAQQIVRATVYAAEGEVKSETTEKLDRLKNSSPFDEASALHEVYQTARDKLTKQERTREVLEGVDSVGVFPLTKENVQTLVKKSWGDPEARERLGRVLNKYENEGKNRRSA